VHSDKSLVLRAPHAATNAAGDGSASAATSDLAEEKYSACTQRERRRDIGRCRRGFFRDAIGFVGADKNIVHNNVPSSPPSSSIGGIAGRMVAVMGAQGTRIDGRGGMGAYREIDNL